MVFYEAPHKLLDTLQDMQAVFGGERALSLCRELTKLHEEVMRTTLDDALRYYQAQAPRGEYVLVIHGAEPLEEPPISLDDGVAQVLAQLAQGQRLKDAVRAVAQATGLSRNELYDAALSAREA